MPKTTLELSTTDYKRNTTGQHRQSMRADLVLGAHHLATYYRKPDWHRTGADGQRSIVALPTGTQSMFPLNEPFSVPANPSPSYKTSARLGPAGKASCLSQTHQSGAWYCALSGLTVFCSSTLALFFDGSLSSYLDSHINLMKICCEPIELACSQRKLHTSYVVWGIAAYHAHASTYVHLKTLLLARAGLWIPTSAEVRERLERTGRRAAR
jgi:hypothetical protein